MIDQRGEWRRVVTDGQRQAHAQAHGQEPGPDELPLPVEVWGNDAAGESRGIRLLPDGDPGRAPGRAGSATGLGPGHAAGEGADRACGADPEPRPIEDHGQGDRPRQLRGDQGHAPPPGVPQGAAGSGRGPLSARVASRLRRGTPASGGVLAS